MAKLALTIEIDGRVLARIKRKYNLDAEQVAERYSAYIQCRHDFDPDGACAEFLRFVEEGPEYQY